MNKAAINILVHFSLCGYNIWILLGKYQSQFLDWIIKICLILQETTKLAVPFCIPTIVKASSYCSTSLPYLIFSIVPDCGYSIRLWWYLSVGLFCIFLISVPYDVGFFICLFALCVSSLVRCLWTMFCLFGCAESLLLCVGFL